MYTYTGFPTYHLASVYDDSAKYTCVHMYHFAMTPHLYYFWIHVTQLSRFVYMYVYIYMLLSYLIL